MSRPDQQVVTSRGGLEASARIWLRRTAQILGLVGVCAIAVLAIVFGETVRDRFAEFGYLTVFVITMLASATLILPAPAALTVGVFAETMQNPWLVGLTAATGQTVGELTGYYVGWSGKAVLERVRGYDTVRRWMERAGGPTLFVLALIPNPFFDIAGMIAGATRFGVFRFVAFSWPGRAIKNIGFAFAGVGVFALLDFLGVNSG